MRYILYHKNCYDGFGSAFAAWKKFGYKDTRYIAVSYGEPFPIESLDEGDEVYILDFSYSHGQIQEIARNCKSVIVLDHHKTAQIELENQPWPQNVDIVFDMKRSGALITWEYLHKTGAPPLIRYISDRDLWEFKLGSTTKLVHKALVSYPMDFELWDSFNIQDLEEEGVTCERLYSSLVRNIIAEPWIIEIDSHKVPVINTSIAWSEIGNELCKKYPDAKFCASFTVFESNVMWSLRSIGDFDVSKIAKKFGGGGHKNAAGFKTPRF